MVIICSGDPGLVRRYADFFGKKHDIRQLIDTKKLKKHVSSSGDVLLIDLEHCTDSDIPGVKTPSMALAAAPVYDQAVRLLRKGVRGYGNRHMHPDNFFQALAAVSSGQVWLPPAIMAQLISAIPPARSIDHDENHKEPLSKREEEVARLVTGGLSNQEIADTIHVSVRTVKAHLTSIFAKTGYRDRLELAVRMKHL